MVHAHETAEQLLYHAKKHGACPKAKIFLKSLPPETLLKDVIKAAGPEAPHWLVWYAHYVKNRPWPEAEPTIAANAWAAYQYARHVKNQPWPEAEPTIAADAEVAYWYARYVKNQPWPEAEPTIAANAEAAYRYARHFNLRHSPGGFKAL